MTTSPLPVGPRFLSMLAALALGVWWLGQARHSAPSPRHELPFVINRALSVTAATPLIHPFVFGDCDLLATVEVPAGGELDLVYRRVEPAGGHGRFSVLRLSAVADAPALHDRDAVLFDAVGGTKVTAGIPASVRLELRGREAVANVAGRSFPRQVTSDDRGDFAFVVRGGTARVNHLQILPVELVWWRRHPQVLLWTAALLGGALLTWLGRRASLLRWLCGLVLPLAAAFALRRLLAADLVASADPSLAALLAAVVGQVALAASWLLGARSAWLLRLLSSVVVAGVVLEACARLEAPRLRSAQDPRLDFYFGVESRQAPFDALAKQLHGKNEVHGIELPEPDVKPRERVMFLGGEPMFEAGLDRTQHLAVQATAAAARATGRNLAPAVIATQFPHTLQQIELYRRFYAADLPAVAVVLGLDRWDADVDFGGSARQLRETLRRGVAAPTWRALGLLGLARQRAVVAPPEELTATLAEFAQWCAEQRLPLILATHARLPAAHLQAVSALARERKLPLLVDAMDGQERAAVAALAQALEQALAR